MFVLLRVLSLFVVAQVLSATWLPWLIPDWVEDVVSAAIFRYDDSGAGHPSGWLARLKKTIGV